MRRFECARDVFALSLFAAAAACGTEPTPGYDDIAQGIGAMVAEPNGGEALSYEDAIIAAGGSLPAEMQLDGTGKISGKRDDVDYKFELTCRDASGTSLTDCTGAASADVKIEWKGKVENQEYKIELERRADWKTDNLTSDTATVKGKGDFHTKVEFHSKLTNAKAKYDFDYDADYKDVLIRVSDRAIIGGEIHYDVHAKLHESSESEKIKASYHVKGRITFSDDGEATITLDEKYKYKLHLSTGEIVKESVSS